MILGIFGNGQLNKSRHYLLAIPIVFMGSFCSKQLNQSINHMLADSLNLSVVHLIFTSDLSRHYVLDTLLI